MNKKSDLGPLVIVPEWILYGVSASALKIWSVLARHAEADDSHSPSLHRIAELTGMAKNTVIRAIAELEKAGALEVERSRRAEGWSPEPRGQKTEEKQMATTKSQSYEFRLLPDESGYEVVGGSQTYTISCCGSGDGDPDYVSLWECSCPGYTYRGTCKHMDLFFEFRATEDDYRF